MRYRTQRNAIVCLTKGYEDECGYDLLIERNRSIYETMNRHRTYQYPLIIWHEGNIPPEHQRYIAAREYNEDLRFIDISSTFRLPNDLSEGDMVETWPLGYRLMCRFHYYDIWNYTRQFDYIMRVDEDCTLMSVAYDPMEALSLSRGDFAAADYVAETHELTNETLAPFAESFAAGFRLQSKRSSCYNQSFPYTNLYVTRTGFWQQPEIQSFLHAVVCEPNALRYRWGDLPVLGVSLNMFAFPEKVYRIGQIGYRHGSHGFTLSPDA
jgi:hypothetical protein